MTQPSAYPFPVPVSPWSDVARLCRRICLLQERGLGEEARELREHALSDALARVRSQEPSNAGVDERLAEIFSTESERVANAVVLAELLAPLLARPAATEAPAPARHVRPEAHVTELVSQGPAPSVNPADLSHFIDEMLAQERPAAAPAGRRVS